MSAFIPTRDPQRNEQVFATPTWMLDPGLLDRFMGSGVPDLVRGRQVIALNGEHANALNYLGYTYADLGIHLDEAEMLVRRALKLRPDDGYITDSLGWVYYKQGNYAEALNWLLKAAELAPDDPTILEHVGDAYLKLGNPSQALVHYEKSLSLREDQSEREKIQSKIDALNNASP